MREQTPPELAVLLVPSQYEDRFLIVETQAWLSHFMRSFIHTSTTEERLDAIGRFLRTHPLLSEAEVRVQLSTRGVPDAEVDERIARARRMATIVDSGPSVFERITRIGYANPDGQEVSRKTTRLGPAGQRVLAMRCRVCGHEYGAYGCDADIRRCPKCQDGWPGLPVTDGPER